MKYLAENKSGLESVVRNILATYDSELDDVSLRFSSIVVCDLKKKAKEEMNSKRGKSIDDISTLVETTIRFPCEISDITGEGNKRKISIVHASA